VRSPIAIITAGGYGYRLGCEAPKSLVICEDDPMITHVLRSLANAGIDRFIIYNNRPEFDGRLKKIGSEFSAVILGDEGVNSTIALAQRAISLFSDDHFLFAYGHAPRPASFIRRLMTTHGSVVVTGVHGSSKASPIRSKQGLWIEPPYRIERNAIRDCSANCWRNFFERVATRIVPAMISEPGEFNSSADLRIYSAYVRNSVLVESVAS